MNVLFSLDEGCVYVKRHDRFPVGATTAGLCIISSCSTRQQMGKNMYTTNRQHWLMRTNDSLVTQVVGKKCLSEQVKLCRFTQLKGPRKDWYARKGMPSVTENEWLFIEVRMCGMRRRRTIISHPKVNGNFLSYDDDACLSWWQEKSHHHTDIPVCHFKSPVNSSCSSWKDLTFQKVWCWLWVIIFQRNERCGRWWDDTHHTELWEKMCCKHPDVKVMFLVMSCFACV